MTSLDAITESAPDLDDDFRAEVLDPARWVGHYLPQWTTPERSAARYDHLESAGLRLRIDADQLDWRPEDAPMRVSNIQTGTYSGPVGSTRGTHRHRGDGLVVRSEVAQRLLWVPRTGRVEVTMTVSTDPGCMVAAWLVGTEHLSERDSAEICLFEIDAEAVGAESTVARTGIKAHHDDRAVTDMAEVVVPVTAGRPFTWAAEWTADRVVLSCDGEPVRQLDQGLNQPLILMVDLFEIGPRSPQVGAYPKTATVHRVRGWNAGGPETTQAHGRD